MPEGNGFYNPEPSKIEKSGYVGVRKLAGIKAKTKTELDLIMDIPESDPDCS